MQPNSSVYIIYINACGKASVFCAEHARPIKCWLNYHKIVEVMAETLIKVRIDISYVFYAVTCKTHQVLNKLR